MKFARFRIANLFYLLAVVAIVVCAWDRFVRRNISEVQFQQRGVTVWFSDEWQYWMGMVYYDDNTGELVDRYGQYRHEPMILLRDANTGCSWPALIGVLVGVVIVDVSLHLIIWRLRRWRRLSIDARNR